MKRGMGFRLLCAIVLLSLLTGAAALAEEWLCPNCGEWGDGNFCGNCGTKRPEVIPVEWVCPKCGYAAENNYCSMCGTPRPMENGTEATGVHLGEMEIFQNKTTDSSWGTYTNVTDKYLTDNYGNTYAHSLSVDSGSLTYLLNYRFETLTGTVAFPKGLASDSFRASASLYIYGDGERLASFVDIDDGSRPEPFSVDVHGVERLTLEWECSGSNIWRNWGYYATIFDGELR